jgi:catechol 2,3-dioxygenase-like lactoylglutathione lyase family enzyme
MTIKPLTSQPYPAAGIHSIDHFALAVPDLYEAGAFIEAFGLRVERCDRELRLRATAADHVWGRIFQSARPGKHLEYVSLGCYSSDLDALRTQVEVSGGKIRPAHERGDSQGFWFSDPDGNLVQVKVAEKRMPDSKPPLADESIPAGVRGASTRSKASTVVPTRLAHLVLFTTSVSGAIDFYQRALGVLVSDRSRELIAFTYGRHGSDHHLLAFLRSDRSGLHHSSWDVGAIGAIGLGAERLRTAGYGHQWGLGRHVLGSNFFNYTRDTWGLWWEHICHIDYVPKGSVWEGGDYDEEDGFYLWGPEVPSDFGINTEI